MKTNIVLGLFGLITIIIGFLLGKKIGFRAMLFVPVYLFLSFTLPILYLSSLPSGGSLANFLGSIITILIGIIALAMTGIFIIGIIIGVILKSRFKNFKKQ